VAHVGEAPCHVNAVTIGVSRVTCHVTCIVAVKDGVTIEHDVAVKDGVTIEHDVAGADVAFNAAAWIGTLVGTRPVRMVVRASADSSDGLGLRLLTFRPSTRPTHGTRAGELAKIMAGLGTAEHQYVFMCPKVDGDAVTAGFAGPGKVDGRGSGRQPVAPDGS
jgi:hypothetical protein